MIGKLTGTLESVMNGQIVLDVGGVGYVVACSPRTLGRCGQAGDPLSLLINMHVREDAMTLFGFIDAAEQHWFTLLHSVQGVGPKAAMAILGVCAPDDLGLAIAAQDKAVITRADGVGPKLATRILTELKDKAGQVVPLDLSTGGGDGSVDSPVENAGMVNDALSALVNLGYARSDAYQVILKVQGEANDNLSDLIRLALRELSG